MDALAHRDDLKAVDNDFVHLFSSWFNRGFLVLRRIDWSTPAIILEKIIRYEAVHQIHDWEDLRRRIEPPDRRCFAFFHPALIDEPLIFVEVALSRDIPGAIAPILAEEREMTEPDKARAAVFYSISNCQRGLAGVSFGSFLIKQVVEEELTREYPAAQYLRHAVAGAGLRRMARARAEKSSVAGDCRAGRRGAGEARRSAVVGTSRTSRRSCVRRRCKRRRGTSYAPATGATYRSIPWRVSISAMARGLNASTGSATRRTMPSRRRYGLMVNYLYDLDDIEKNHEAFAESRTVVASNAVQRLLRPTLELVPIAGVITLSP